MLIRPQSAGEPAKACPRVNASRLAARIRPSVRPMPVRPLRIGPQVMSDPADSPNTAAELRSRRKPPLVLVRVLDWIPWGKIAWEKLLIWGLFLLVVYALRHFFLIIFMTFILTYIMRGVVRRISRFV